MRDVKCRMKFAPTANRKEEAERLNHNDAPISTRLRSKDKDVRASICEPKGVTGANNHTDKQSQPSKHQHDKSNHSEVKKSEVHTSSPRRTGQPSTDENAKDINDSTVSPTPSSSRQLSKGPDNSKESKSLYSRNEHKKKRLAQKRATQAKSETGNVSSSSHWKEKEKSTRPSQEPPKQPIKGRTRPSEDQEPAEQPILEAAIHYIGWEGFGKVTQSMGYICQLCEKDLAVSPIKEEMEPPLPPEDELFWDYIFQQEEEQENSLRPEVSVFPCGHVFHIVCFELVQLDEHLSVCDPTCPICLSFS